MLCYIHICHAVLKKNSYLLSYLKHSTIILEGHIFDKGHLLGENIGYTYWFCRTIKLLYYIRVVVISRPLWLDGCYSMQHTCMLFTEVDSIE